MGYAMPATLSFCMTGGRALFLDTKRNRYFHLAGRPEKVFQALMESGGAPGDDVEPLVRLGVLQSIADDGARLNQAAVAVPSRSIIEQGQASAPLNGRLRLEVAHAVAMTWVSLKGSSLASVVERHRVMSRRLVARGVTASHPARASEISSLSAAFNQARRVVPIDMICLLDSLALHRFLARRGQAPRLVIGVRLNPFAAHCWVQHDDIVLNDAVERASTYTPILVV